MPWIATVPYAQSTGKLRQLYDRVKGPGDTVDNIMQTHSLRPHTMEGHMAIYKYTLHHSGNTIPKWFLETLGVWVSSLNHCGYCVDHHFAGLERLLTDPAKAVLIRQAIEARDIATAPLNAAQKQAMLYAQTLTLSPGSVTEADIIALRHSGFSDDRTLGVDDRRIEHEVVAGMSSPRELILNAGARLVPCGQQGGLHAGVECGINADWQVRWQ